LHAQAALHWLICQKKLYLKWAPRNLQISGNFTYMNCFWIEQKREHVYYCLHTQWALVFLK
jgi:hypothetical protein